MIFKRSKSLQDFNSIYLLDYPVHWNKFAHWNKKSTQQVFNGVCDNKIAEERGKLAFLADFFLQI